MMMATAALRRSILALAFLGMSGGAAFAEPIVTGKLKISPTVADLRGSAGNLASDDFFYLIYEGTFTLTGMQVDILGSAPGLYDSDPSVPGPFLAPGTYQSWILHSDNDNPTGSGPATYTGSVTFEADIVGLMLLDDTLTAADGCNPQSTNPNRTQGCSLDPINALFGPSYMRYATGQRGLELGTGVNGDRVELVSSKELIITQFRTSTDVDQVRILTQVPLAQELPEPASMLLLGTGLLGLTTFARRRRS